MKRLLKNKNGEGYVDMCVFVVVFVMIIILAMNIFSFITLKVELDQVAEELIETATYSGRFDDEFYDRDMNMLDQYFYYDIDYGADKYYNATYQKVQLGDPMWVTVSVETYLKGFGEIKIPVTVSVTRSGISQHYWK